MKTLNSRRVYKLSPTKQFVFEINDILTHILGKDNNTGESNMKNLDLDIEKKPKLLPKPKLYPKPNISKVGIK